LAVGGHDENGQVLQAYSFDSLNPGNLETVGTATTLVVNSNITSLDWCLSCSYLSVSAAPGRLRGLGALQIFSFDHVTGFASVVSEIFNRKVDCLKWCSDCGYLAFIVSKVGVSPNSSSLMIYHFDPANPHDLAFTVSIDSANVYSSIDCCGNCGYIAAGGGIESGLFHIQSVIDIYHFDAAGTPTLTLITSTPLGTQNSYFTCLKWCQGCDNLAAVEQLSDPDTGEEADVLHLYHFDSSNGTLTPIQTYTLEDMADVYTLDWCGNCCDLSVGGLTADYAQGFFRLFQGNPCLGGPTSPTNLTAQKLCHRFPTQIDIINQLCWNAVTGAVSYNVYADSELSILLATITNTPLCYSQHQICKGKLVTYYVTAVDAQENQSEPVSVTI